MKRASAIALLVVVAAIGTALSCYVRNRNLERAFDRVTVGMAEQQIVTVMGKPDSIGKCGELGGIPPGCSKEYLYSSSNPLTLVTWAVFVDANGHVLDKYQYSSP
jgi:hypothetical protein